MLTRAAASGPISEASTPVSARSSGPTMRRQRQAVSATASSGTRSVGQMIDNSSGAQLSEMTPFSTGPAASEAGIGEPAGSRHTAYSSGSSSRSSMRADYGFGSAPAQPPSVRRTPHQPGLSDRGEKRERSGHPIAVQQRG